MRERGTILVVDDERDVLEMIEAGLGLDGYRVLLADSGEQAIDLVAHHRIDLVISDLRMPGMNGVETIARLRQLAPRVPVIVVTGYLSAATADECLALGGVELLPKPFPFVDLRHAVRAALPT
ncbi:MAG TPA: response regulator [Kofleriaceae bacterium]|nr:response regulator [Kofleriaceae bacterium]